MLRKEQGFNVIELMITLAIVGVIASFAVPSFTAMIKSGRLGASYNGLTGELAYARSEAVKRNVSVSVCASSDMATCDTENWELGRLVFVDDKAGTTTTLDGSTYGNGDYESGDEELLKVFPAFEQDVTVRTVIFTNKDFIKFSSLGVTDETGTVIFCDDRGPASAKAFHMGIIGRVMKAYDSDASGLIEDFAGDNIVCP